MSGLTSPRRRAVAEAVPSAEAAERALALLVGRRGRGGHTGIRLGSVVHGLLHRAHCPVITVLSGWTGTAPLMTVGA